MDPFWGGFSLGHGHFPVKMFAKTKELGPVWGRVPARPLDPPMVRYFCAKSFGACTFISNSDPNIINILDSKTFKLLEMINVYLVCSNSQ